jgi:hypothetical protein
MSTENPTPQRRTGPHAPLPTAAGVAAAVDEVLANASAEVRAPATSPTGEEDPRKRAAKRAAELREHGSLDEGTDKFYIDPSIIPDGWSYEWRTHTILGKEDPSYEVNLARRGWEPVPRSRHPFLMPEGYTGETILRDGQMLMERPAEITNEAKAREYRSARDQVRAKEEQLGAAPPGQFGRDNKGAPLANVKKSFESIPIPER